MFDDEAVAGAEASLTDKQRAVLGVIREHCTVQGYPPTVREIGRVLGLASSSTVHSHLAALERAGLLLRDPTKPRALRLAGSGAGSGTAGGARGVGRGEATASGPTDDTEGAVALPMVGQVAAGSPILADEHVEARLQVPQHLVRSGNSFLLRVRGDSMVDAGILDGDVVVVRSQRDAEHGEIVVAMVDDEATCKRLVRRAGRVELHSENPAYEPIVSEQLELAGVVTGVMRAV